jgi:hypothetical protein
VKRVLIDKHHADLFYGLQRLFEDRLGYIVFTPVGHDWWDEGYWRFGEGYGDDRLARQFLNSAEWYGSGVYVSTDPHHPDRPILGVDLDTVLLQPDAWSHVVATVQDNQAGFARLARELGAKYVYHVGNTRQQIDWSLDPLVLNASEVALEGRGVNIGQEFDHTTTFRYREPVTVRRITSFVNLLPLIPEAWQPFEGLRTRLPSYEFRSFGHECPDGFRRPVEALADEMALAGWAYHDKVTGDGFGHVIHNWAAVGRPLIGHARYYAGQRAEPLWRDLETCIDLDRHDIDETARLLREITPERHAEMCRAIRETFEAIYDPAADAEAVRGLL